ncbi:FAD-dependent oxidoreductase [Candidatus Pacearchaeota archaeon]|nr:FAD-dependent oxidoreductase [Candidatus Pacearchaeota archaeon]
MKKVVIIGGGFAGSYIARKLENKFEVVLIDSKDYFEFTPGILRTIVEPSHIRNIQILHTHYLKRSKVIVGCVDIITKEYITLENNKIYFDYLVICSGSSYNVPFKEKDIIKVTRAKHLRDCYDDLCKAKEVLIIGGGLVGVELAAEICTHYDDKKIIIIHSKEKLIERNHEKAIRYAEKFLKRKGVKIVYAERAIQKNKNFFLTDKGNKFKADMAFLCTGITPNYDFMKPNFPKSLNKKNQIIVNEYLQLIGERNIFAAGDITDRLEEKTAQNAERQSQIVVNNIIALENKEKLKDYHPRTGPLVISLGKLDGIFSYKNLNFNGIIPAFLKFFIEKREMWKLKTS